MTSFLRSRTLLLTGAVVLVSALTTGCGGGKSSSGSDQTTGVTITVALATEPPPQASLDAFTKSTGITVKWTNTDWDSLQTKIAAAATAKTYFADATDVDCIAVRALERAPILRKEGGDPLAHNRPLGRRERRQVGANVANARRVIVEME